MPEDPELPGLIIISKIEVILVSVTPAEFSAETVCCNKKKTHFWGRGETPLG